MTRRAVFVGLCTLDVVHRVDHLPGRNEKITATSQFVAAGGPATNAAVTFAGLGGRATLVTSIGEGLVSGAIREDLQRHGVEVLDVGVGQEPAVSAVALDARTGDRSVTSIDAAASRVVAPTGLDDVISGADVVMVDGHHPELALWAARTARTAAVRVVADAGRWRPVFADLLPLCADVICSADFRTPGASTSAAAAEALAAMGPVRTATSHGPEPITWWSDGRTGEVMVPEVVAVDTLGAGDVLHGAFTYYSVDEGLGFATQLAKAAAVAALRCSTLGPRAWLDDLKHLTMEDDQ